MSTCVSGINRCLKLCTGQRAIVLICSFSAERDTLKLGQNFRFQPKYGLEEENFAFCFPALTFVVKFIYSIAVSRIKSNYSGSSVEWRSVVFRNRQFYTIRLDLQRHPASWTEWIAGFLPFCYLAGISKLFRLHSLRSAL